jgi:hypothetical protein
MVKAWVLARKISIFQLQISTALIIRNCIRIDVNIIRVQSISRALPISRHHLRRANRIQIIHIDVSRCSLDAEDPRLASTAVPWGDDGVGACYYSSASIKSKQKWRGKRRRGNLLVE